MRFFLTTIALCAATVLLAQSAKVTTPPNRYIGQDQKVITPPKHIKQVPPASELFGVGDMTYKPISALKNPKQRGEWYTITDEAGLVTFAVTTNPEHQVAINKDAENQDLSPFLKNLPLTDVQAPEKEFVLHAAHQDEQGNSHFRMDQVFMGVPVYGSEIILHSTQNLLQKMNGRYFPTPKGLMLVPSLTQEQAHTIADETFGTAYVKKTWTAGQLSLIGGTPFKAELVIYHVGNQAHLSWQCTFRPNVLKRLEYIIDAHTGVVLNQIDRTCSIHPNMGADHDCGSKTSPAIQIDQPSVQPEDEDMPPTTGTGPDLFDVNRSFGAWQEGSKIYMMDATKSMFNSGASKFPGAPVGVIITLDAMNTSPQNESTFNYTEVSSTTTSFSNKKAAVSAHLNAGKCYDYFKNTHNRNSIDGVGGNVISLVNVAEDNGSSMENAFWNGDAMWYGNGGQTFLPLARGLDVGGHEITHGVIEKTANLIYQNQSGALNESFADVFGVMIDRDDWKVGEDVVRAGVSPGGCLRSMENPNNGSAANGNFWQPKHMNEIFKGSQDNGGVHINSGITNHAFYLFAINPIVTKEKAEKVYYKALRDYLTKNSKFIDCRVAVVQSATELYGAAVANAAGAAFDAVGIGAPSGGGGAGGGGTVTAPPGNLLTNPGQELILVTTEDGQKLQLANGTGNILGDLYIDGILSRPSVTDNGDYILFVNKEKQIIGISLTYQNGNITPTEEIVGSAKIWRNAAISKDGRFAAAVTDNQDNVISIFNFTNGTSKDFALYNPTYTNGQITKNVDFADVLEFDYSGKSLMYDARNNLNNQVGDDISYWDIGFLNFWTGSTWTTGDNTISKLFNGLPDNVSVGNPTFSKNSPHIIAFDVIDDNNGTNDIFGANTETGDNGALVTNNGDLGWPSHNRLDNSIAYESPFFISGIDIFRKSITSTKIAGSGSAASFIKSRIRPVWFANGSRSLSVKTTDAPFATQTLEVYPNPTEEGIWMRMPDSNETIQISLFSADGREIYNERKVANELNYLPMSQMPQGIYHVRIITQEGVRTAQVVKGL
jgi:Zn-dependent metalloprotease